MQKLTARLLKFAAGVVVFAAMTGTAEAGPPLICHPFDAGTAALLPWGSGPGWNTPDRAYDLQKLTADTLRLLASDAPVLARMENMRRATIYAGRDRKVAAALLKSVIDRAKSAGAGGNKDATSSAYFDAGYLIETYRQYQGVAGFDMLAGADALLVDLRDVRPAPAAQGYTLVTRALQIAGRSPEMDFAASLMTRDAAAADHRRRAMAGAPKGSLLARNIAGFQQ